MPLNPSECKVLSFSHGIRKFSSPYVLLDNELERVKQIRDLGVVMDASLNYSEQLKVVIKKCLRLFGFIRNITLDFTNLHTIAYLYKALVLLILTYCIPIWCPKTDASLKELIAIEHKFLRYASTKNPNPMHFLDHDYTQIRYFLKIESLRSQIKKIVCIIAFKLAHKLYESIDVNNLFVRRSLK